MIHLVTVNYCDLSSGLLLVPHRKTTSVMTVVALMNLVISALRNFQFLIGQMSPRRSVLAHDSTQRLGRLVGWCLSLLTR